MKKNKNKYVTKDTFELVFGYKSKKLTYNNDKYARTHNKGAKINGQILLNQED